MGQEPAVEQGEHKVMKERDRFQSYSPTGPGVDQRDRGQREACTGRPLPVCFIWSTWNCFNGSFIADTEILGDFTERSRFQASHKNKQRRSGMAFPRGKMLFTLSFASEEQHGSPLPGCPDPSPILREYPSCEASHGQTLPGPTLGSQALLR